MSVRIERQWLTYQEAQELAGLGRTKLWQLIAAGDLPAAKVGVLCESAAKGSKSTCEARGTRVKPAEGGR